ncbi:uncharacterized protein PGTG_22112 [Puccinia graminis f. sp. tritici CRL 75-36-700-3]|uniref:Uncharacterized protein n=1 Tax=Puccinia graminis f. sp. tritici (strain CRL 75-36-700-3 / race SCCL) TaxID=418459 RepID=H6QT89_PUCGT|nr:uncharacterized protein PGTG_22112 [Puccinia graminis f. sp. tritici CRL 75-36-700-3]EHS64057.1 hypothetical protein PGTG_22112 [Puccinia graminis f. sp. tritici CRL 75-36-700-3]
MHAEIINTHVPGNSLNSCRCCTLNSETLLARQKIPYLAQFTQKKSNGENCLNPLQIMEETKQNSKKLWTETRKSLTLEKLRVESSKLAVQDQLNLK